MPNAIITGSPTATFQGNVFRNNPRVGFELGYSYRGPALALAKLVAPFAIARQAFSFNQHQDGTATLTLESNASTLVQAGLVPAPVDNWQLHEDQMHESWKRHPVALQIKALMVAAGLDAQNIFDDQGNTIKMQDTLGAIEADMNSRRQLLGTVISSGLNPGTFNMGDPTAWGLYNQLWPLLQNDQDHYAKSNSVLRHEQTIDDSFTGGGFNFKNLNALYTPAQVLTECALFPYPLPALYQGVIAALPVPAAQPGYLVSWLKKSVTAHTIARYKTQITTEFVYDQWSTLYYGVAQ